MKTKLASLLTVPPRASSEDAGGTVGILSSGCAPADGSSGVSSLTTLRVCAFNQNPTNWAWQDVTLDGVAVTPSSTVARMSQAYASGRAYLLVTPYVPFEASSTHTLQCVYRNTVTLEEFAYVSTFTVSSGDAYTGTTPNYFERLVLAPCTTLLDVEPLRLILLDNALVVGKYGGAQDQARAARVLYQIALGSDASALLNPYGPYDAEAHTSNVSGRRTRFDMLNALRPYERRVDRAIAALVDGGPVPPALAVAIVDGYDSALYTHKLATICVLPFLARAIEEAQT